ncbi:hypothetical protein HY251_10590, partial [bacterium]|nr:hypothetical protein [bacterium]
MAGCGLNSGGNGFPTPPTVVSVTKSSGDAQTGTPGTALPQPLVALVTDQFNTPLNNVPVVWTVTSGGGAVTAT